MIYCVSSEWVSDQGHSSLKHSEVEAADLNAAVSIVHPDAGLALKPKKPESTTMDDIDDEFGENVEVEFDHSMPGEIYFTIYGGNGHTEYGIAPKGEEQPFEKHFKDAASMLGKTQGDRKWMHDDQIASATNSGGVTLKFTRVACEVELSYQGECDRTWLKVEINQCIPGKPNPKNAEQVAAIIEKYNAAAKSAVNDLNALCGVENASIK
jgi:hypothetical protein